MRKSLSKLVMVFTCLSLGVASGYSSVASAQKATRKAQKTQRKAAPKAASKASEEDDLSIDDKPAKAPAIVRRTPRETAIRAIGITSFATRDGISPEQAANLTKQVVNDLTAMSYLQGTAVTVSPASRAEMLKAVSDANLDGVLIGTVGPNGVKGSILSKDGGPLATYSVNREVQLGNDAQVKAVSRAIVDEIARTVPYRGFVTRKINEDQYEINLGKDQGILKGQRFRLFEFTNGKFGPDRADLGEVEVMETTASTSVVEPTGSNKVFLFTKVGHVENARGMATPEQIETRGYAKIGAGLLNISGTGDPKYVDRAYNISSTPGFLLGGGWGKYAIDVLFAQATGENTDLVYTEILFNKRVSESAFGGLNKFVFLVGARGARVNIATKKSVISALDSTTSISPEFQGRIERIIRGPVHGFIGLSAYFPIYVTGMSTSAIIFSYGIGAAAGLSLDISNRMAIDVGARSHYVRRPVDGQSSVSETYTELLGDIAYRF